MGNFYDSILKRIQSIKADSSSIINGLTMTGEEPNKIEINPDVTLRTEAADYSKHHVLFWGRANPPHAGHEAAYKKVKQVAKKVGGTSSIVLTRTQDMNKNPLSPDAKLKHAKRAFPDVVTRLADPEHTTIMHELARLHERGITHLHMVAGADRLGEYKTLIDKYNGKQGGHGYFNFRSVQFHSSGKRDPDSDGVDGVSASAQREHVRDGNYVAFAKGAPKTLKTDEINDLFNDIKAGIKPKTIKEWLEHD